MASEPEENVYKKNRIRRGKIRFEVEVVPKHAAHEILAKEEELDVNGAKDEEVVIKPKQKKRKQKDAVNDSTNDFAFASTTENLKHLELDQSEKELIKNGTGEKKHKKKKKKRKDDESVEENVVNNDGNDISDNAKPKKIRKDQNADEQIGSGEKSKKKKKKRNTEESVQEEGNEKKQNAEEETKDDETESGEKPKKKKKKRNTEEPVQEEGNEEPNADNSGPKKKESIRERKRKKYAQLLAEKKSKTELALQQKSLNYLSKWKHSRNDWKFEKLRQIWLQQNMYDSSRVPSEFWETLVEYFSNSKGKAREVLLKEALKIIEEEEGAEDSEGGEKSVKAGRARDIIQNLQE